MAAEAPDPKRPKLVAAAGPSCSSPQQEQPPLKQEEAAASGPSHLPQQQSPLATLRYGVSEDKGCRPAMEDVAVCLPDAGRDINSSIRVAFFGVFDGHGGRRCAEHAAEHLHAKVLAAGLVPRQVAAGEQPLDVKAAKQAIVQGFKDLDAELLRLCAQHGWADGAAAVAVWLVGDTCLCANVGDAKAVLARRAADGDGGGAGGCKAITLSKDHLAIYPAERARIEKAGGTVSAEGRLNGRIQISRSFGDAAFKGCGASATPDVAAFRLTARDRFLLAGCDGFWGVFDAQGAVDGAAAAMAAGKEGKAVTNRLLNEAVRERRCKDNCTCLLVHLADEELQQQQPQQHLP